MKNTDWTTAFKPLIKKYKKQRHPLEYKNIYQLLVMVVLSARDTDKNINLLAPLFFAKYKDMKALAEANENDLLKMLLKVRGGRNKTNWLMSIAKEVKIDENIPLDMESLVKLKGIGRKSANVILREAGRPAEGIMVDLHVQRVVPRLGLIKNEDPKKIETALMNLVPNNQWSDLGMSLSFLGRETCRPKQPEHQTCVLKEVCEFYQKELKTNSIKRPAKKPASIKKPRPNN